MLPLKEEALSRLSAGCVPLLSAAVSPRLAIAARGPPADRHETSDRCELNRPRPLAFSSSGRAGRPGHPTHRVPYLAEDGPPPCRSWGCRQTSSNPQCIQFEPCVRATPIPPAGYRKSSSDRSSWAYYWATHGCCESRPVHAMLRVRTCPSSGLPPSVVNGQEVPRLAPEPASLRRLMCCRKYFRLG